MHFVEAYLYHHTNRLIRRIRYKESCLHLKLDRHHRRRHRRQSLATSRMIDIYPQIIVDVPKFSLNRTQLEYLSQIGKFKILFPSYLDYLIPFHLGTNYIRPNQSYLHSYERRQKQIKEEHKNMMNIITPYLVRVYRMSNASTLIKQFSQQLETCMHEQYMAPLSYLNIYRARKEWKLMKSVQFRIKKENYILRVTDKSGVFHLGHAEDYEQKGKAYQQKTGTYIELESDPLWSIFDKLLRLLNDLRSKDQIRAKQLQKMMPK
jgi:hypothetical protein